MFYTPKGEKEALLEREWMKNYPLKSTLYLLGALLEIIVFGTITYLTYVVWRNAILFWPAFITMIAVLYVTFSQIEKEIHRNK